MCGLTQGSSNCGFFHSIYWLFQAHKPVSPFPTLWDAGFSLINFHMVTREDMEVQAPTAASVLTGWMASWASVHSGAARNISMNTGWSGSSQQWEMAQDHPFLLTCLSLQGNSESYLLQLQEGLCQDRTLWLYFHCCFHKFPDCSSVFKKYFESMKDSECCITFSRSFSWPFEFSPNDLWNRCQNVDPRHIFH